MHVNLTNGGSVSWASSAATAENATNTLSRGELATETTLALLAVFLMAYTFWILASYAGHLLRSAKYPSAALAANMGAILEAAWPISDTATDELAWERNGRPKNAIWLLYVGDMTNQGVHDRDSHRVAKGMSQCDATIAGEVVPEPPFWITSSSPMIKVVIPLAIWGWVSVWIMTITFFVTLIHNGIFSHEEGSDSYPRLVVVAMYFLCFGVYAYILWLLCLRILTQLCASAAWSLLNRSHFAVVDRHLLFEHIHNKAKPLDFGQIETSGAASTSEPGSYSAALDGREPARNSTRPRPEAKSLAAAQRFLAHSQEKLRGDMYTCADKALDLVLFNIVTALGICVTQAFSAWTKRPLAYNSSTQIGSVALVASVLLGMSSMFRSALHLSTAEQAYHQLLDLKEIKTNLKALEYANGHSFRDQIVGFCQGRLVACPITLTSLFRASSWAAALKALVFGPMFSLLPNANENTRRSGETGVKLCVRAMGQDVEFTTTGTSRDSSSSSSQDPQNVNSIKVRCTFDQTQFDKALEKLSPSGPSACSSLSTCIQHPSVMELRDI
ncbi:hypothetical protein E5D57_007875 [Metarhizium anisopliae]|nr:hypothetical protein E5D57_007875 [Metarhizium anisopliae]